MVNTEGSSIPNYLCVHLFTCLGLNHLVFTLLHSIQFRYRYQTQMMKISHSIPSWLWNRNSLRILSTLYVYKNTKYCYQIPVKGNVVGHHVKQIDTFEICLDMIACSLFF